MTRSRLGAAPSRFGGADPATQRLSRVMRDRYELRETIEPWRRWYKTARWQSLRWSILVRDLFTCSICGDLVADTSQLVADHIVPHRGDAALFWDIDNIQCLCAACHNRVKQAEERATG